LAVAALPYGEQRIHAEFLECFRSEHFNLHAGIGEILRSRGELCGSKHIAGSLTRSRASVTPSAIARLAAKACVAPFGSLEWMTIFFSVLSFASSDDPVLLRALVLYFLNL
jgi:hypothetical protein